MKDLSLLRSVNYCRRSDQFQFYIHVDSKPRHERPVTLEISRDNTITFDRPPQEREYQGVVEFCETRLVQGCRIGKKWVPMGRVTTGDIRYAFRYRGMRLSV